jgi:hypothetical protein
MKTEKHKLTSCSHTECLGKYTVTQYLFPVTFHGWKIHIKYLGLLKSDTDFYLIAYYIYCFNSTTSNSYKLQTEADMTLHQQPMSRKPEGRPIKNVSWYSIFTNTFKSTLWSGVAQGRLVTSILFSLYVNEIPSSSCDIS